VTWQAYSARPYIVVHPQIKPYSPADFNFIKSGFNLQLAQDLSKVGRCGLTVSELVLKLQFERLKL